MIAKLLRIAAGVIAFGTTGTAMAQTVSTPANAPAPTVKAEPAPLPAPDPARMAIARQIAMKVFPPGSFREMLGDNYDKMMSTVVDSMGAMPMAELAQLGGLTEEQVKDLGEAKMSEVMDIIDPAWRERLKLMTDVTGSMVDTFEKLEPRIREAMARSFAREYTIDQLTEIMRFLDTPTGAAFGKKVMMVMTQRDVADELAAMMPEIMKEMPAAMEAQRAKIEALPERRKIEELSDEDRQRLADLLGVDVADLNDPDLEGALP